MDRKEEHEHSPDDVNYHLVDKECRKKSHELIPWRDVLYHQDYHDAILSNFSMEGTSSNDDDQDISHLTE